MSLLLNYRPVLPQPTGIGVYANAILPALQELPHRLITCEDSNYPSSLQRINRLLWTQYQLPRIAKRSKASLIFTPAPEGYLGKQVIRQVVMVHDLRPLSHPERSLQSFYFRSWVPSLLSNAQHVLTNSLFTALEIQRCTNLRDDKISVIPLGYDTDVYRPRPRDDESSQEPYLLHVGQAYPHKNLIRLIKAFRLASNVCPDLRLILAGKPHPRESIRLVNLVNTLGLSDKVEFLSYVRPAQLPELYRGALALVYPSLWEGFGLPVLEAMASGTPVITSLGSATSELAADAAVLIDPYNINQIASAVIDLVRQPSLRSDLIRRGLLRSSSFSWSTTSASTAKVLSSLI